MSETQQQPQQPQNGVVSKPFDEASMIFFEKRNYETHELISISPRTGEASIKVENTRTRENVSEVVKWDDWQGNLSRLFSLGGKAKAKVRKWIPRQEYGAGWR